MINLPTPRWLLPPVGLLIAAGAMLLIDQVPGYRLAITGNTSAMWGFIVLALWLDFGAITQFLRAKTGIIPLRETPTQLVTTGWYRWTRNPMYLGMVCWLLAVVSHLQHWLTILVIPIFMLWITLAYIMREEALLAREFGSAYDDYRQRVRRWL